jgi:hypothetical protein
MKARSKPGAPRLALAGLVFAVAAPAIYVAQRVYQRARSGEVDPALILESTHVDYLWRVAVATWCAGACALVVVLWRGDERRPLALAWGAVLGAALVALLAWRYP